MKTKFNNLTIQQFNNRGFTLIELIVVFSVIAILSTIGVVSFVSYSRIQTLQQATNDFVNVLNTAKARSISQIKPSQCNSASTLNGYVVIVNVAANFYTLNVVCSGITSSLSTTALPVNVSFNSATSTPPTTTTSIFFSVLTGGIIGAGDVVFSYPSVSGIQPKTVTITSVGGIQ